MDPVTRRLRDRRRSGTAIVELALVLPLLLFVLFGVLETSLAFFRWQTVNNAAREGARTATLDRINCLALQVETEVENTVDTVLDGANLAADDLVTAGQCQPSTPANPTFTTVTVTVNYEFQVLPGLANLLGGAVLPNPLPLTAQAVMRNP